MKHESKVADDPVIFEQNMASHHQFATERAADYERELCDFIKDMTGAREVFPQIGGCLVRTSRMSRYNPAHRWYYLSDMEPDDLLLFKGFDSDIPDAMNAMHSSFDNPLGQDGEPRRSIETRLIAIFD